MTQFARDLGHEVGELLRLHRIAKGISLSEFAETTNLTVRHIEGYEAGSLELSVAKLFEFSVLLDVSPTAIVSHLTERLAFVDNTNVDLYSSGVSFLASNRGRQLVRAISKCERPELLEAVCSLLFAAAVTDFDARKPVDLVRSMRPS